MLGIRRRGPEASRTGSKRRRRTISKASSVATGFHSACNRPKVFSSACSAVTPRLLPASMSDSGKDASRMAFGTSLIASVSACTKERLLS